ncbi:hypothetical protein K491DRAFT_679927 [Lophiostoma macrostomum CBS 122681]|uniref:Uncharacterized protein n=1 Tax=Lophiostoma macrostomum CBS 122681 TaxID=1314788 RepID=A0A6A6T208_9PLEO|nr:hypothetical protein K491DRAFT_679927 [Lophiostoma macrostomum CBS 122681]
MSTPQVTPLIYHEKLQRLSRALGEEIAGLLTELEKDDIAHTAPNIANIAAMLDRLKDNISEVRTELRAMRDSKQPRWQFCIKHAQVYFEAAQVFKKLLQEYTPEWQEKWQQGDPGSQDDRQSLRPRYVSRLKELALVQETDPDNGQMVTVLVWYNKKLPGGAG